VQVGTAQPHSVAIRLEQQVREDWQRRARGHASGHRRQAFLKLLTRDGEFHGCLRPGTGSPPENPLMNGYLSKVVPVIGPVERWEARPPVRQSLVTTEATAPVTSWRAR